MINGTEVRKCECKSAFQDTRYGKRMRVFNSRAKEPSGCSVCGRGVRRPRMGVVCCGKGSIDFEALAKRMGVYYDAS